MASTLPLVMLVAWLPPCASPTAAQTGAIGGSVALPPPPPPRRSADRYARGPSPAHEIQQLPAVVYVVGPVAGADTGVARHEMIQRDTAFAPAALVVPRGGSVAFPNADPFFHNVFSYSVAQRFDLGRYPQGESKSVTFDEPGVVNVFCEVHDFMRGVIVVSENPFHAIVAQDGSFRLDGVPAGEYTVRVWHSDHDPEERTVTVRSGATARVEVELGR